MNISFEKEIIAHYKLPSIPKKEWDGKSSFQDGVAIINLLDDTQAYAACRFNKDEDKAPRIIKTFGFTPFKDIEKVFVIPSYMDNNVEDADLDKESKKRAEELAKEARELEGSEKEESAEDVMGKLPEWIFDHIHNKEEAIAYIRNHRKINGIKKGNIPTTNENIKLCLYSIYSEMQDKTKNK